MTEWQTIETAPRYGRTIVASVGGVMRLVKPAEQCDGYEWVDAGTGSYVMPSHWFYVPEPPKE